MSADLNSVKQLIKAIDLADYKPSYAILREKDYQNMDDSDEQLYDEFFCFFMFYELKKLKKQYRANPLYDNHSFGFNSRDLLPSTTFVTFRETPEPKFRIGSTHGAICPQTIMSPDGEIINIK